MNSSKEAFDALRIRIWADAAGVIHSAEPDVPAVLGDPLFTDQADVDQFNEYQASRDLEAEHARALHRWEAWEYVAQALGWTLPSVDEVYSQPAVWCAP